MNVETCKKYLKFVHSECERHLADGVVTDDELFQLIIEFERFQKNILESDLPEELKLKINAIEFLYTREKVNRSSWFLILAFITFGTWALIIWLRKQNLRKQTLENLKHDMNSISMNIQMNYS